MSKLYLISGISGQLGSEMARFLLNNGEKVIGIVRRSSLPNYERINDFINDKNLMLITGDITDSDFISRTFARYRPDVCFWYAAQSFVQVSFEEPTHTWNVTGQAVLHALEAIRNFSPNTRFIQASSSEMFGNNFTEKDGEKYQCEETKMEGVSPYGISKLCAFNAVRLYRSSYNLFTSNIIMFNCEGKNRGQQFVTRKISMYVAKLNKAIRDGLKIDKLKLGNIYSYRDWGETSDYIRAYILASDHTTPDDFVICTSETHTIEDFLTEAFNLIGISDWSQYLEIDESLKRPTELDYLRGKYDKAKRILGWEPKVKFKELVKMMVEADIRRLSNG